MKTFAYTFSADTDYVNKINYYASRQANLVELDFGYSVVCDGEMHILLDPSVEHGRDEINADSYYDGFGATVYMLGEVA